MGSRGCTKRSGATSNLRREQHPLKVDALTNNYQRNLGLIDGGGTGSTQVSSNYADEAGGHNQRTTDGQTMMHILKANIGTGVLAMPLAFKNVGLWLGLVLVPTIGAVCIHCMNILIASHNRLCDRFNFESLDYDQVAGLGLACGPKWARRFAKKAHIVVAVFLMFTQIGFCCVYTLFTVENLQVAMLNLFGLDYSITTYLIAVYPVIGLTSCTSNLKHLARISTLANCLQLFGLALIFFDLLQFHTYSSGSSLQPPADDELMTILNDGNNHQVGIRVEHGLSGNILNGLPLFFATAVYAFEGIGVVLPLIKEMQHPARISGLNGVLNTSMSMVALLYMAVGFFGYAKYGQTVAGSITLNLPETTLNELVRLAFALAIGLSYSLQFYVPWTIVWPLIDESLFYSYRPRVPRDKLDILQKLNKDNHWLITGQAIEEHQREQALRRQRHEQQLQLHRQQVVGCLPSDEAHLASPSPPPPPSAQQQLQHRLGRNNSDRDQGELERTTITIETTHDGDENDDDVAHNSTASTLASSYTISTSCRWHASGHLSRSVSVRRMASNQYGSIEGMGTGEAHKGRHRRLRNRLCDVMEREPWEKDGEEEEEDDDDDVGASLPDVQWRPPPRSMRGKRKLVRYTVILLTVSFTFIAAALIPRLDLFISLIGALASSSLAIIFPAIIQLCTFWNYNEEDEEQQELGRAEDQATLEKERERRRLDEAEYLSQRAKDKASRAPIGSKSSSARRKRKRKAAWTKARRIKWCLFVLKNALLVLFGFLGLITGTWVSLAELGVAELQVNQITSDN